MARRGNVGFLIQVLRLEVQYLKFLVWKYGRTGNYDQPITIFPLGLVDCTAIIALGNLNSQKFQPKSAGNCEESSVSTDPKRLFVARIVF